MHVVWRCVKNTFDRTVRLNESRQMQEKKNIRTAEHLNTTQRTTADSTTALSRVTLGISARVVWPWNPTWATYEGPNRFLSSPLILLTVSPVLNDDVFTRLLQQSSTSTLYISHSNAEKFNIEYKNKILSHCPQFHNSNTSSSIQSTDECKRQYLRFNNYQEKE
jgi:hypothetical protein